MQKKIFEITKKKIVELTPNEFDTQGSNKTSLFVIDIQTPNREQAAEELKKHGVHEGVRECIVEPEENIRFQILDNYTYGELAYFSLGSMPPLNYIGVIGHANFMYLIYDGNEELSKEITKELSALVGHDKSKIDLEFVMYVIINEILSSYGKLILNYREEIEDLAKDFDRKHVEIDPDEILESKSHLSDFSRVFEKLYFTLNFPPAKDKLGKGSPYQVYFGDLMKILESLKLSLSKTEDRLNSLHDHYLLLLQEKSNKRINFLTIIQAIFVPLTLLAGIYGMNFQHIPELELQYGYFISLGLMVIIAIAFLWYFYKHGWFD